MKKVSIALFLLILTTKTFAQITENFDGSFCTGLLQCWQRDSSSYDEGYDNRSINSRQSICSGLTQNTTSPINGTGSLHDAFFYGGTHSTYAAVSFYYDTLTTNVLGSNGNNVSFKIRFSLLDFPTNVIDVTVRVVCGNFNSTHSYIPSNVGTIFTINETLTGVGTPSPVKIIISALPDPPTIVAEFELAERLDIVFDIDDFVTNASYDLSNPCNVTVLPIKFKDFYAKTLNCNTQLNWITSNELNVSHFEIQQSNDAVNFHTIGTVLAKNNITGFNYSYIDVNASENINFYRLVTFDFDGKREKSTIIRINGCKNNKLAVYPNPVQNILNIDGIQIGNKIEIINSLGQVLITKISFHNNETLDISKLPSNNYLIAITNIKTQTKETYKFTKL